MISLARRVANLETRLMPREPPPPVFSEEDVAIMQRIITKTYSDPVRNARRIELFERCRREHEERVPVVGSAKE